jgi:hypothetical protein
MTFPELTTTPQPDPALTKHSRRSMDNLLGNIEALGQPSENKSNSEGKAGYIDTEKDPQALVVTPVLGMSAEVQNLESPGISSPAQDISASEMSITDDNISDRVHLQSQSTKSSMESQNATWMPLRSSVADRFVC